jgi:hypothetical protein
MYCHICFYLFTTCFDLSRGHHQVIPHYKTCGMTNINMLNMNMLTVPLFQIINTQQDAKHQNISS